MKQQVSKEQIVGLLIGATAAVIVVLWFARKNGK